MVSVAQLAGLECLDLFGARIGDAGCASLRCAAQCPCSGGRAQACR